MRIVQLACIRQRAFVFEKDDKQQCAREISQFGEGSSSSRISRKRLPTIRESEPRALTLDLSTFVFCLNAAAERLQCSLSLTPPLVREVVSSAAFYSHKSTMLRSLRDLLSSEKGYPKRLFRVLHPCLSVKHSSSNSFSFF